jgi:predicted transcriptional regulator of viral defense system
MQGQTEKLTARIQTHLAGLPEGASVSAKELLHLGSRAAVDQTLSRLAKRGLVARAGRGLYVRPVETRFGTRPPSVENVVQAIAKAKGETIASHGATAANALVPRVIHITGYSRFSLTRASAVVNCQSALVWF